MANPFEVQSVNPLQALMAGYKGYEFGAGIADRRRKENARTALQQLMASGGTPDLERASMEMLAAGDTDTGIALARLADARANNAFDRTYKTGMLDLQRQAATRREEPEDIRKLRAAGVNPNSPEGRKALFPKTDTPISATDKKAVMEAEDVIPQVQGTIENLNRALDLNNSTFSGMGAGARGTIGANLPDWLVPDAFADKKGALVTQEWQKIMGPEALKAMSETLKGATTDFELRKFNEMLADPATDPKVREGVIKRMLTLAQRKMEIQQRRVKELRSGEYYKPTGPTNATSPDAASDPVSQARAAIAKGAPRDAVIQRLRQNGIDPSGL